MSTVTTQIEEKAVSSSTQHNKSEQGCCDYEKKYQELIERNRRHAVEHYHRNKEKICKMRSEMYKNDPKYRERIRRNANRRYHNKVKPLREQQKTKKSTD